MSSTEPSETEDKDEMDVTAILNEIKEEEDDDIEEETTTLNYNLEMGSDTSNSFDDESEEDSVVEEDIALFEEMDEDSDDHTEEVEQTTLILFIESDLVLNSTRKSRLLATEASREEGELLFENIYRGISNLVKFNHLLFPFIFLIHLI